MKTMKDIYLILPILLCVLLLAMPTLLFAVPTGGVAVPLQASKQTSLYKNPTISTKHAPIVGQTYSTPTMRGGAYRSQPAKGLYNVSSGTVQSYAGSQYTVSSQGGVVSVMPTYQKSTTFSISQVSVSPRRAGKGVSAIATTSGVVKRRIYSPGVSIEDGNGNYWDEDANDWVEIPESTPSVGEKQYNNTTGLWEVWNGSEWVPVPAEPTVPVGDVPWWLLAILIVGWKRFARLRKAADAAEVR